MANKIIQMWEESSHTTALYPTSVAEAIKWDSSTTVAQKIASVEDKVGTFGPDTSRILYSRSDNYTLGEYTATEDCIAYMSSWNAFTVVLDGIILGKHNGGTNSGLATTLVKKGSTIQMTGGTLSDTKYRMVVFGLKKGA